MKVRTKYGFQQHTNYNGRNHKTRNQTLSCSVATWRAENMHYAPEMSGLWNFSVRVQSWSAEIESDPVLIRKIFENRQSDPVLIRQCKIIYFYFVSWGKRTTVAVLPSAKYYWLKAKYFQQCFCFMRQNSDSLLAFPKFNKEVSIRHQRKKHCWSYFAARRIWLLRLVKWQGRDTFGIA